MTIFSVVVSSTDGVGKSVQGGSENGTFGKGFAKTGEIRETRTEMGNYRSRNPNLMFVFNKNRSKPRFLGLKKDCTSQDSNPGPQHWNFKNCAVSFL